MKKIITLYLFLFLLLSFGVKAQNVQNYVVTAGSNESFPAGGTWTQLIGSNQIAASAVTNIGFETWFMGERFTQFSVNTNGVLRFGNTPVVLAANTSNVTDNARICAFGGVGYTPSDSRLWRTETDGQVRYKVIGTAPDRILVVDWINIRMAGDAAANTGVSRFQVHVYETTPGSANGGVCKIIYGNMRAVRYNNSYNFGINDVVEFHTRTGIGYEDGVNPNAQRYLLINTNNHPSVAAVNLNYGADFINQAATAIPFNINLHSNNNLTRKFYSFDPPAPTENVTFVTASCVSDNEILLNWSAPVGNQVGYVIYRSDDGGSTYDFLIQIRSSDPNPFEYLDTGLTAGTEYFYRVFTVTEGKLSALTANNQVTATTTISPTVFSVISNIWSSTTTWSTSSVPVAAENVVIGCPTPHTVVVNTNGVANDLTVESGSILNFNAGQTLTVQGNVINRGTINTNGGTLIIQGNIINEAGATINVGTGSITAQGNLTNNATATVNINSGTLRIQGNLQNNATATLNGNTGLFRLGGNFINQGVYNSNTSTMRFDGTAQQLINHTGTSSGQGISTVTNSYNNAAALVTPAVTAIAATAITIPDATPAGISQTISFPATTQAITNVTLNLQINHSWVGDLICRV